MIIVIHNNKRNHKLLKKYALFSFQKDDGLKFLSVEEKECILFFENTIDSLEEGFEDTAGLNSRRAAPAESLRTSSNSSLNPVQASNASPGLMEHDIIDLVRSPSNFTMPGTGSNCLISSGYDIKPCDKKDIIPKK